MKANPFTIYSAAEATPVRRGVPLLTEPVPAGFPSPAEDYVEDELDLHKELITNPAATYILEVSGDSMIGAGLQPGDRLIVDCSREPLPGKIVIAAIEGELTVKRLIKRRGRNLLKPENDKYDEIDITDCENVDIRGVVTYVIHRV